MAEPIEGEVTEQRGVAVQQPRQRMIVESPISIMDTAKFEHLARIASVMADAGLMPESLTFEGPKDKRVMLPDHVIKARAFLICGQADRWNMDPLAVMGCCSLVHNSLMYEGKLVYAVIEARLGVRLSYEFGQWDAQAKRVMIGVDAKEKLLGVVASGTLPGEDAPRTIEGYVGLWETSGNNTPWGNPGNWKRQLRYRGSREWANAYSPGIVLGVVTDEDLDEMAQRSIESTAHRPAPSLSDAFGGKSAATKPGAALKKRAEPAHDPETGEIDPDPKSAKAAASPAETGDAAASASTAGTATEAGTQATGDATTAKADKGVGEQQEPAEKAKPAAADKAQGPTGPKVSDGFPLPGETYHIADALNFKAADGKWDLYKDGELFSRAGGKAANRVYAAHAPREEAGAELDNEAETKQGEASETADKSNAPADMDADNGDAIEAFNAFAADLSKLDTWPEQQALMSAFRKTDAFKGADRDLQNRARILLFNAGEKAGVSPAVSPILFTLWLLQADDKDKRPMFSRLIRSPEYQKLTEDQKETVADALNQSTGGA
jgi:hypothetical protein